MQTSYIYSVSRANALSEYLLTKTDIERLLVATAGAELRSALKETYLAPYIVRTPNEDLAAAVELTLVDAKKIVHQIAPFGDMFRVLWIHYDIHNLRVFAKAKSNNLTFDEVSSYLSHRGIYEPAHLFEQAEAGNLDSLQVGWEAQRTYNRAVDLVNQVSIEAVDSIFDELYFTSAKKIAATSKDDFVISYLAKKIDLYNIKNALRAINSPSLGINTFIEGGTVGKESLSSEEDILLSFARFGGMDFWNTAIATYKESKNTTSIDVTYDEYMISFAKSASQDMFGSASLVLYYLLCRQSVSNVRTIVVGKNSGMSTETIRTNLRMAYVND